MLGGLAIINICEQKLADEPRILQELGFTLVAKPIVLVTMPGKHMVREEPNLRSWQCPTFQLYAMTVLTE